MFMSTREYYKKPFKLHGPFLWTGFTCHKVICHYWAADYFQCYLNEVSKSLSHSCYILSIGKD